MNDIKPVSMCSLQLSFMWAGSDESTLSQSGLGQSFHKCQETKTTKSQMMLIFLAFLYSLKQSMPAVILLVSHILYISFSLLNWFLVMLPKMFTFATLALQDR